MQLQKRRQSTCPVLTPASNCDNCWNLEVWSDYSKTLIMVPRPKWTCPVWYQCSVTSRNPLSLPFMAYHFNIFDLMIHGQRYRFSFSVTSRRYVRLDILSSCRPSQITNCNFIFKFTHSCCKHRISLIMPDPSPPIPHPSTTSPALFLFMHCLFVSCSLFFLIPFDY